jgi:hypothetical protein
MSTQSCDIRNVQYYEDLDKLFDLQPNQSLAAITHSPAPPKPFSHGQPRQFKRTPEHEASKRRKKAKKSEKRRQWRQRKADKKRASRATGTQEDLESS